jgi:DNA excision repair protein ERCC-2
MDFFPYNFRKNQKNIIQDIKKTLDEKVHIVFESGTGSGKTICVLTSTLQCALENNKKIVYTTRTNAQQRQVIVETRAIREKVQDNRIFCIGMQGRANMCIFAKHDSEMNNGTSEELSRFCSNQKKLVLSEKKNQGCEYYRNIVENKDRIDKILAWTKEKLPTAEEFIDYCEKKKVCPYELNKLLVQEAQLIVVPYIYVFDKSIRVMLFDWLSVSNDDIILVIDEAHNLPDYLRDLFSAQLSIWMLNNCLIEAEKVGDPSIAGGLINVSNFCKILVEIINGLRDTYVYNILEGGIRKQSIEKNDAFIPSHELESELISRLKTTSHVLEEIINDLIAYGEKIQEYRKKEGKLPRSYIHKLGVFLRFWSTTEMNKYIKLIVDASNGKNPRIEAYCLDPSIGTEIIRTFHSSIHMSGTLNPLEEYRDSIGLPNNSELKWYPSPFSIDNRRIFFTRDVTTKYEEIAKNKNIISRLWMHISNICNTFPKNTIVFFPSFNIMSMFQNRGYFEDINRCLFIEEQSMSQTELMNLVTDFKKCGNENIDSATLFSVVGGRISEGMDFPAEQLEIAVIIGIPYPKPTARQRGLQRYYEYKFGKGWEYTVNAPAARKLMQSIGRLIRDEKDKGVAVILDKRATRFKTYIRDLKESRNLISDITNFLHKLN